MLLKYGNYIEDIPEGYINNAVSLLVNSCGTYKLSVDNNMTTERVKGRNDYQLIYVSKGQGWFSFDFEEDVIIKAGSIVIYRPDEYQKYIYYGENHPEIYWIHFTGNKVEDILKKYEICLTSHYMVVGDNPDYAGIFERIIVELQGKKEFYSDTCAILFHNLLIQFARYKRNYASFPVDFSFHKLDEATAFFQEHYNEFIVIEEYIKSSNCDMCESLFYRQFKEYTGQTPLQYVLGIRLQNAKELLINSDYSIREIAESVGYENALYFSRVFHKYEGLSPTEFRKNFCPQK